MYQQTCKVAICNVIIVSLLQRGLIKCTRKCCHNYPKISRHYGGKRMIYHQETVKCAAHFLILYMYCNSTSWIASVVIIINFSIHTKCTALLFIITETIFLVQSKVVQTFGEGWHSLTKTLPLACFQNNCSWLARWLKGITS